MVSIQFLVLAVILISSSIAAIEETNDAKLLVSKAVLNNYVVEGQNLTVKYTVYNIGNV